MLVQRAHCVDRRESEFLAFNDGGLVTPPGLCSAIETLYPIAECERSSL